MKETENDSFQLELSEVVRINQLVRNKIDFAGFTTWYKQLSLPKQCGLINFLKSLAEQAGGTKEDVWNEALKAMNFESDNTMFKNRAVFLQKLSSENWLKHISDNDRFTVFKFVVHLFGIAEGKIYRNEEKSWCNHWWHRDLFDERVVSDLLNDPKYYMTSMKDDERVKRR